MTFKQFLAFATAAKYLNITRASEELHISQPSISKQLRFLQDDYNVKLYYKNTSGGIQLTEHGRILRVHAQKILRELAALRNNLSKAALKVDLKSLAVGGTYSAASNLLPALLREIQKIRPQLQVTLCASSSADIENRILKGTIEIGLISKVSALGRVTVEHYCTHTLIPFVSARHPFARRRDVTIPELLSAPLVLRGKPGSRGVAETVIWEGNWAGTLKG